MVLVLQIPRILVVGCAGIDDPTFWLCRNWGFHSGPAARNRLTGPTMKKQTQVSMTLALETSCDETSAAVVCDGRLLSNVVASQVRLHAKYGGVVPELATREHLRNTMRVVRQALGEADLGAEVAPSLPAAFGSDAPRIA